jgi:cytochrome bd-type quinol oxidase subunit 2
MSVKASFKYAVIGGLTGAVIGGGFISWVTATSWWDTFLAVFVGAFSAFVGALYGGIFISNETTPESEETKRKYNKVGLILVVVIPIIIVVVFLYGWTHAPRAMP